jgi:Ca-activated chloride channel family protein
MHGESKELKDEVIRLARDHGIVTPYTAYLIMEDERSRGVPLSSQNFRELQTDSAAASRAKSFYDSAKYDAKDVQLRSGGQAVENAQSLATLKESINEQAAAPSSLAKRAYGGLSAAGGPTTQPFGYRYAQNYAQQARVVAGRAFYQNADTWTDSTIQSNTNAKHVEVKFDSDEYYALLKKFPQAGQWMSLGNNVDLMLEDTVYCVR